MTATAHAVVGGAIAAGTPLPISLPLALTSHFLMDLVPHWDFGTHFKNRPRYISTILAALDVLFGFALVYFVFGSYVSPVNLWLTVLVSQLPDWIGAPNLFFNLKLKPAEAVLNFQRRFHGRLDLPWGIVTQLFLIVPLLTSAPPSVLAK